MEKQESAQDNKKLQLFFNAEEIKQFGAFFAVLAQIDRRTNITKTYGKPNN